MRNSIDKQRKHYSKNVAENFDRRRMNSNHLYKIETIVSFFEKYSSRQNVRVLEVGGGTGLHAEYFLECEKEKVSKFVFSDLSDSMLAVARQRLHRFGDKVQFVISDAESFKADERMDCIYVSGAMHHFESPVKAIRNFTRSTTPGGIVIICEPVITCPYAWPRVIFKPEEYGQFKVTPKNIQKWLTQSGYEILDKKYLHYRSNSSFFRCWLKLEKIPLMNWSAVMFAVVARKPA